MNQEQLKKRCEAIYQEQMELVQDWIDNPEYFEKNRHEEVKIIEDLQKEYDSLIEQIDIESRCEWFGPRWYQMARGWIKPEYQIEYQKAIQLTQQFDSFKALPNEDKFARFKRFTQIKINGGISV
ncbi:MAG: hypothetical protein NE327_10640 [Lentisphaeraceae bacterium]|nr:hypothetical protein [Lentisphaeraceae bacterium]